jgi:nucleotide-binding universal stress UspA family protein
MHKILVTTDFSSNSKAGLRFAIQLASQNKFELTFFHSCYSMKPTSWSDAKSNAFQKEEEIKLLKKLNQFVDAVYKSMNLRVKNMQCIISSSFYTDSNIREYAEQNKFSFICISTRGAGKIKKFLGTNTSNLINHSHVPVIAIPRTYHPSKIKSILYASDLVNLEKELRQVIEFAGPLKAKVEMLHFNTALEITPDSKSLETKLKKISKYDIKLHFEKLNPIETLISKLESTIKKTKPSMLIMFTQQNRSFFEKIFLSSESAEYSFKTKIPLLVFNKS